ncbi:MAG: hypothetical protein EBZ74_12230, partial [Planctomycetia bacterium]|nr:hypothetical protein [Planctomycetia bacterium]
MSSAAPLVAAADTSALVAPAAEAGSVLADVSRLVRPRIALMVLATVVSAYWLTGGARDGVHLLGLLAGTALVAASSSIANQVLERDTDRLMPRTARRPIVAGRLAVGSAWLAAATTLAAGVVAMTLAAGWPPTAAAV